MKNVDIFFSSLPNDFNGDLYLSKLPLFLQDKIHKIKDLKTKKMAIFNKVFLQQILNDNLEKLKYTEFGRPYLENYLNFNISHSNQIVICAISKYGRIGIDVEELKEINFQGLSKRYFHKNEQQLIDNQRKFFEIWTRKEAILKAHGCGLRVELKQLDTTRNPVELDQNYWLYLIDLPFKNSVCHLATSFPNATLSLQAFEFPCGY
jgi:4'-phosphopantetheinyl transferase